MIVTDYRLNANHNGANNGITQQQIVTDYRLNANHNYRFCSYAIVGYNLWISIKETKTVVICI
jgi:hypothetical protein